MTAIPCEVVGCERASEHQILVEALNYRQLHVCGGHRIEFLTEYLPNPEVACSGDGQAEDGAGAKGRVPRVRVGDDPVEGGDMPEAGVLNDIDTTE